MIQLKRIFKAHFANFFLSRIRIHSARKNKLHDKNRAAAKTGFVQLCSTFCHMIIISGHIVTHIVISVVFLQWISMGL